MQRHGASASIILSLSGVGGIVRDISACLVCTEGDAQQIDLHLLGSTAVVLRCCQRRAATAAFTIQAAAAAPSQGTHFGSTGFGGGSVITVSHTGISIGGRALAQSGLHWKRGRADAAFPRHSTVLILLLWSVTLGQACSLLIFGIAPKDKNRGYWSVGGPCMILSRFIDAPNDDCLQVTLTVHLPAYRLDLFEMDFNRLSGSMFGWVPV